MTVILHDVDRGAGCCSRHQGLQLVGNRQVPESVCLWGGRCQWCQWTSAPHDTEEAAGWAPWAWSPRFSESKQVYAHRCARVKAGCVRTILGGKESLPVLHVVCLLLGVLWGGPPAQGSAKGSVIFLSVGGWKEGVQGPHPGVA